MTDRRFDEQDEERATETIVPGRQLMQVGPIDLGKRLKDKLKALAANPPSPPPTVPLSFVNFGYDWRLSLHISSANLLTQLEQLKAESAARGEGEGARGVGATVIAHSMGGLVALHALAKAKDPRVFKGLIFAGTPFGGCGESSLDFLNLLRAHLTIPYRTVNVLSPLRNGDGVMFARQAVHPSVADLSLTLPLSTGDICSPSVVFSMRSSYYFLPLSGHCFETSDGTRLDIDFYDPHSYSDYNLSPVTKGLYREKGFARDEERREGMQEAAHVNSTGGAAGFGEGNLGEAGTRSKGIEETLTRAREEDGGRETPEPPLEIPQEEAEGEVDIDDLPSPPDSRRPSANEDLAVKMDRGGSNDSTAAAAAIAGQGRRASDSSEEEPPVMPELDKVLSASDTAIASYLLRTLNRVKQVGPAASRLSFPCRLTLSNFGAVPPRP